MKSDSDLAKVFENISDDIDLFLEEKNFVIDIFENYKTYDTIIEYIRDLRRNRRELAQFYNELFVTNPDRAIKMMGKYIELGHRKGKINLGPIETFLNDKLAWEILDRNKDDFIQYVYPVIWKRKLFEKIEDIGMTIEVIDIEYPPTDERVNIKLCRGPIICASISSELNTELIDEHYLTSLITPSPIRRDVIRSIHRLENFLEA